MVNKKKVITFAVILVISAIIIALIVLIGNKMTADAIRAQRGAENYLNQLSENCICLAKNRPVCELSGFEYNSTRQLCVNSVKKEVTYPSKGCSQYNCSGEIKLWNNLTENWENKTN